MLLLLIGIVSIVGMRLVDNWMRRPVAVPLPPVASSERYPATDVTPHVEDPLVSGRNYVYCGSFQLAWNEFADGFGEQGVVHVHGAAAMEAALNRRGLSADDLPSGAAFAFAGSLNDAGRAALESGLRGAFPQAEPPQLPWGSGLPFAFAYLERGLPFAKAFERLPTADFPRESGRPTEWFGIDDDCPSSLFDQLAEQVVVHAYRGSDEFVVELATTSNVDQLLLALFPRPESMQAAIARVDQLCRQVDIDLHRRLAFGERLAVPVVALGVDRRYTELLGGDAAVEGDAAAESAATIPLDEARQIIRLRLDRHGFRVRSQSLIAAKSAQVPEPRNLSFDRPFLLLLRKRGVSSPYLAVWIENAEVLQPATPAE